MNIFLLMIITSFIIIIMFSINWFSGKNKYLKISLLPFECGIETNHKTRNSFSLHFFRVLIIFVFFDMEVLILFNFLISNNFSSMWMISIIMFIFFIFGTLLYEWSAQMISWEK